MHAPIAAEDLEIVEHHGPVLTHIHVIQTNAAYPSSPGPYRRVAGVTVLLIALDMLFCFLFFSSSLKAFSHLAIS